MAAKIDTLISWQDGYEIARNEVEAIIALESVEQQALATSASEDPDLWKLDVYSERHNAVEKWRSPDLNEFYPPIINVWLDSATFSEKVSHVRGERGTAVIHIDCYGLGISERDISAGGHKPGDREAALNCQRAARLVRNILRSEHYTYLGSPQERQSPGNQWCFGRRFRSLQMFQPEIDRNTTQSVVGARLTLEAEVKIQVPEVQGQTINFVHVEVQRDTDGKILVQGDYESP